MERNSNGGQQARAKGRALRVGGGVRRHTIRRQLYIYLSLIGTGAYFVAESGLEKLHLISEGAAFIMVGIVGLIMSTTTTDIGQSLMLAVREEGKTTRAVNRKLVKHMVKVLDNTVREEGRQTRAAIEEIGRQAEERDARMEKRLDRMSSAVEAVSNDIKAVSNDIKAVSNDIKAVSNDIKAVSNDIKAVSDDNREFFRQMLEAQNRILEKVS